jgi:integrase
MPYAELPAFMAKLSETPGVAAKALAFTALTAARSGETLGATWDESDFDNSTWTVGAMRGPGERRHPAARLSALSFSLTRRA